MGAGSSLRNKLARGETRIHENRWEEFSHADNYLEQRIEQACEESSENGNPEDPQKPEISEFGIWWRYQLNGKEILFMNKKKRDDGDGFSYSEVLEIATQIEEASLVSYNSDTMQHFLIRCKEREFYVEINSMGDVRLPCATYLEITSKGTKYFIRTDNPYEIANFSTRGDWDREDSKTSRRHFINN